MSSDSTGSWRTDWSTDQVEVARLRNTWRKRFHFFNLNGTKKSFLYLKMCHCIYSKDKISLMLPSRGRILFLQPKKGGAKQSVQLVFYKLSFLVFQQQLIHVLWNVTAFLDIIYLISTTCIVSTDDCSTSLFSNAPLFLGQTGRNSLSSDSREKPKPWTDLTYLQWPQKRDGVLRHVPGVLRDRNNIIAAGHSGSHSHQWKRALPSV